MQIAETKEMRKKELFAWGLVVLFFVVLATITFRCVWGADNVFSASDVNIGGLAFRKHRIPELFFGYFTSTPVLGNSNYNYSLFHVLLSFIPLTVFADIFYGLILVAGSLSCVWFLRIWNRSWFASIVGALVAFWFNSITLASAGHVYKIEVLALSVLSLVLIEKAIRAASGRNAFGYSILGGLSVGVMIIEQQDVAIFAGLFIGSYAVFRLIQVYRKVLSRWLTVFLPVGIVALLLSGSTILRSYETNVAGAASVQGAAGEKWNYITQWSMVPGEWPDLVAPGWSGWSSGNPKGPYWGKIGRSEGWELTRQGFQNLRLDSIYIGIIPFLLAGVGLFWGWKNRKSEEGSQTLFWTMIGLAGFWLAFGKYSLLYKLFYQLPLVNNIRAPIKLLDNFQICLAFVAAFGLDALLRSEALTLKNRKWIAAGGAVAGGLMLVAGLWFALFPGGKSGEFSAMGMGAYADLMTRNISSAWVHAGILGLIAAALVLALWKKQANARWVGALFVAVLAADSVMLTSHYFRAENIADLRRGSAIIHYLKENQGNERVFLLDQSGIYKRWLAVDRSFHKLDIFNIWQMPRMPLEYKEFLGTVGRNQIRLWELSSIKYVAASAGILQQLSQNPQLGKMFEPVLNYQVPTAQGMRPDVLLEFKNAVPRFALFKNWNTVPLEQQCAILVSGQHNPHTTLLVDAESGVSSQGGDETFRRMEAKITHNTATVTVETECPAILRFSQRHQPGWAVYIDGKAENLLKVDYLCMGVSVPSGKHVVEFRCISGRRQVLFISSVFFLSLAGAVFLLIRRSGINES